MKNFTRLLFVSALALMYFSSNAQTPWATATASNQVKEFRKLDSIKVLLSKLDTLEQSNNVFTYTFSAVATHTGAYSASWLVIGNSTVTPASNFSFVIPNGVYEAMQLTHLTPTTTGIPISVNFYPSTITAQSDNSTFAPSISEALSRSFCATTENTYGISYTGSVSTLYNMMINTSNVGYANLNRPTRFKVINGALWFIILNNGTSNSQTNPTYYFQLVVRKVR